MFEESVVKKYADIITQFETSSKLPTDFLDDFEQEDNMNDEKEMYNQGEELEMADATTLNSNLVGVKSMTVKEVATKAKERIKKC